MCILVFYNMILYRHLKLLLIFLIYVNISLFFKLITLIMYQILDAEIY